MPLYFRIHICLTYSITLACYTIHFLHQEAQYDVKVFFNVFNNCFVKLLSILTRKSSIQAKARVYFGSWHDKNTDACRWHSVRQWRQTKGLIPPTALPGGSCKLSHEVRIGQWLYWHEPRVKLLPDCLGLTQPQHKKYPFITSRKTS